MVNLIVAGALSGLGKGLDEVGQDILKRREEALKWAQENSLAQQRIAAEDQRAEAGRQFQAAQTIFTQDRTDARAAASQQAIADRQGQTQKFQHGETVYREGKQDQRTTFIQNREDARSNKTQQDKQDKPATVGISSQEMATVGGNLRDLQGKLAQINTPASQRLQGLLQQSQDLIGLRYGSVGQNGRAPVFGVTKQGKLKYMGFDINQSLMPDASDDGL